MTATYRLLITGSRSWRDRVAVAGEIGEAAGIALARGLELVVVHGDAPEGADAIAEEICRQQGIHTDRHPALWQVHGWRRAGIMRNTEMVAAGADMAAAFALPCAKPECAELPAHPTHGTSHCAETAARAGVAVTRIGPGWQQEARAA